MPVRIENITMDCRDERTLSAFWTAALGYESAVDEPDDWVVQRDPGGSGPSIGPQGVPEPKVVKNRVHIVCGHPGNAGRSGLRDHLPPTTAAIRRHR